MNKADKERYKYIDILGVIEKAEAQGQRLTVEVKTDARECLCSRGNGVEFRSNEPILAHNLNTKSAHGICIDIPRSVLSEGVITIDLNYSGQGVATVRNILTVERGSHVKVVVNHHSGAGDGALINSLFVVQASKDSNIEVVEMAQSGATLLSTLMVEQKEGSVVRMTTLDIDNKQLIRNQDIKLLAQGADCSLNGLYLTSDNQRCDNYINVRHLSENCTSNQNYKGVMGGSSVASFTGSIFVERDAQKTFAYQQNHNILLSDKARVYTRPQLEIYADDVKCNHGATVGRLDPEAIYYMRQRGISLDAARRLQIVGFAEDVVRLSEVGELQGIIQKKIVNRLTKI